MKLGDRGKLGTGGLGSSLHEEIKIADPSLDQIKIENRSMNDIKQTHNFNSEAMPTASSVRRLHEDEAKASLINNKN